MLVVTSILCLLVIIGCSYWYWCVRPTVPPVIHQLAPLDKSKWHASWQKCQETWKHTFPDFTYILWDDEMMDSFMQTYYPQYYDLYRSYAAHICRVDMVRYFILYTYGGIYADMDVEVMKGFMHLVPKHKVSVIESPYKENENCQNALMISPPGHPFWLRVFDELKKSSHYFNILDIAGPRMLDRAMKGRRDVHILPCVNFNPSKFTKDIESNGSHLYTKHHGTSVYIRDSMVSTEEIKNR